ncbi:MAG: ATP-binding protein [Desulfobulbaceae bacterium]|nr:ATP-binding protein [Desulfobulbaceae bacterium]
MKKCPPLLCRKLVLTVDELARVRDEVRRVATKNHCPKEVADALVLAVNEACANIIIHGYGPEKAGEIIMEIFHNDNEISVRLTDFAPTVDCAKLQSRDINEIRPGGLGMFFINELMDKVEFSAPESGVGNILQLTKKIKTEE